MQMANKNQCFKTVGRKKHASGFLISGVRGDFLGLIQHFWYNPHFFLQ